MTITIISHDFKRRRFLGLHCAAIRFPIKKIRYIGIDPPEDVSPRRELEEGEEKRGYGAWKGDLYGSGKLIMGKRRKRGWSRCEEEVVEAELNDEGLRGLFLWKGGGDGMEVYWGSLPWDEADK